MIQCPRPRLVAATAPHPSQPMDTNPTPRRKSGRKPILKEREVADALVDLRGNISATALRFGVSRSCVHELCRNSEQLRRVLVDCREARLDRAEDALGNAIDRGEAWSVCFI